MKKIWEYTNDPDGCSCDIEELNFPLDGDIIVIADLGLWNGRFPGYKIISGNIAECFRSAYDAEWWITSQGDLHCAEHHHDGTNYLLYREIKDISNVQRENLFERILRGSTIESRVTRKIGTHILKKYGL